MPSPSLESLAARLDNAARIVASVSGKVNALLDNAEADAGTILALTARLLEVEAALDTINAKLDHVTRELGVENL